MKKTFIYMKKNLLLLFIAVCGFMAFQSCSDDDDNDLGQVSEEFVNALKNKFPDATGVKWEQKSTYRVAEFKKNMTDIDVWFNPKAEWVMTNTDYGKDLFMIPSEIGKAFADSQFADWTIDDIDLYERPDKSFYVFEVEKKGMRDMELYFNTDGSMIKAIEDADMDILPTTPV